jgi:hypothetical protein
MLRLNGRPVAWLGVGAPDAVGPGIAALQSAIAQYGGAGRANPGDAVAGLQAAGQAAVKTLGPDIDAMSGNSPNVMNSTQLAWQQNSALAALNSGPTGTQSDVDAAKAIVNQMITYYQQAASLAASPTPGVAPALPPKTSGSSSKSATSPTPSVDPSDGFFGWLASNRAPLLAAGGAAVVGGVALVAIARHRAS